LFAGYFLPPFYHLKYPLAIKYGYLGFVLGHELMHAFDADNINQRPHPEKEWLDQNVAFEFKKRANCLVRQYAKHCFESQGECLSGEKTLSENIADIDGIKVAYTAFKFATQVFGDDPPIPSMLKYTNDQLFFLATAVDSCKHKNDTLELDQTDTHSPSKIRVDMALSNVPVFARAFRCEVGSKYAPLKICTVWGDLANPARKR